jgi:hypothetical protein
MDLPASKSLSPSAIHAIWKAHKIGLRYIKKSICFAASKLKVFATCMVQIRQYYVPKKETSYLVILSVGQNQNYEGTTYLANSGLSSGVSGERNVV